MMKALFFQLIVFSLVLFQLVHLTIADCWWTGCQPNSWAVTGCDQYNKTESNKEDCEDGSKYYCCDRDSEKILHNLDPTTSSSTNNCWWTGCQPSNWVVTGCGQYNRTQKDIKDCKDGSEYYCCTNDSSGSPPIDPITTPPSLNNGCWWTGCQLNNWAVTGCGQYILTQKEIKDCENGHEYYFCPGSNTALPQLAKPENYTNCVWSPCQPSNWTERGCPTYMIQTSSQSCGQDGGDIFQCCEKKKQTEENDVNSISGESFHNLVKFLLLKSKNFTIEPDSLPCTTIDVEKQSILQMSFVYIRF